MATAALTAESFGGEAFSQFAQGGNGVFTAFKERPERCFSFERGSWAKAYVQNRISLLLYFDLVSKGTGNAGGDAEPNVRHSLSVLVFEFNPETVGAVARRNDKSVLVDTVQLGNFPQSKLTSFVRLYRIEKEIGDTGPFFLYRSIVTGFGLYIAPLL